MNCNTTHYRANSSSVPGDPTFKRWRERALAIQREVNAIPFNDTSSRYDRDRAFWFGDGELNVGKVAGWIFINEDKGRRMK